MDLVNRQRVNSCDMVQGYLLFLKKKILFSFVAVAVSVELIRSSEMSF